MSKSRNHRPFVLPLLLSLVLCAVPLACNHQQNKPAPPATAPASKTAAATKPTSKPVIAKWTPRPYPTDQVNLIVFGDFGNGKQSQKDTAKADRNRE